MTKPQVSFGNTRNVETWVPNQTTTRVAGTKMTVRSQSGGFHFF